MGEPQILPDPEMVHDDKRQKLMCSGCPTLDGADLPMDDADLPLTGVGLHLDDATHERYLSEQTKAAAELSLKGYQHLKGVKYKLDRAVNSNGFYRMSKHVIHVNFTATKVDGSDTIEYFFAEVTYNHPFKAWRIRDVVTFNPADKTNLSDHCSMCSERYKSPILHPAGSYVLGQYDEDEYIDFDYDYSSGEDDDTRDVDDDYDISGFSDCD